MMPDLTMEPELDDLSELYNWDDQQGRRPDEMNAQFHDQVLLSRPSWEPAVNLPGQMPSNPQLPCQPPQNPYYPEWQPPSSCFEPTDAFAASQSWSPGFMGGTEGRGLYRAPSWLPPIDGGGGGGGGQLHAPYEDALPRRGFSLGALPSLNEPPMQAAARLERPRSQGSLKGPFQAAQAGGGPVAPSGEDTSIPFAFSTSRLSLDPARTETPAPSFRNKESAGSQVSETGATPSLRPRLEAKQPENNTVSVHLMDAAGTELGDEDPGKLPRKGSPRKSMKRAAGGAQRMAYRVRSNALANLQMSAPKSRASESGAREATAEAPRSAQGMGAEHTASGSKEPPGQTLQGSVPGSSLSGQQTTASHSDMELLGQQANDEGTVRLDPRKLAQFCKQLQHIQRKVVRLQAERLANSQREEAIKMAGSCMQLAVQDLAAMKEQGAPLEQREARLAEGASQMQQLLGLLGPAATATATGVTSSQEPTPGPSSGSEGHKAQDAYAGGDEAMQEA